MINNTDIRNNNNERPWRTMTTILIWIVAIVALCWTSYNNNNRNQSDVTISARINNVAATFALDSNAAKDMPPMVPRYSCLPDVTPPDGYWNDTTFVMDDGTKVALHSDPDYAKDTTWRKQIEFLLVGCPKCGSTSTCEYLVQHPNIMRPNNKETQCFFMNYNESDPYCSNWYDREWLHYRKNDLISGDMTPEYLFRTSAVIPRAKEAFPWAKIVAILRHPVERAYSEYRMKIANGKFEDDFERRVLSDLEYLKTAGLLPHIKGNPTTLREWITAPVDMNVFDEFHGSPQELAAWRRLQETPGNGLLARGLYRLELSEWMKAFPCKRFLVLKMEDYAKYGVEMTLRRLHRHLELDYVPLESTEAKNTRHVESDIDHEIRDFLNKFFEPYNNRLYEILGEEWKEPW